MDARGGGRRQRRADSNVDDDGLQELGGPEEVQ